MKIQELLKVKDLHKLLAEKRALLNDKKFEVKFGKEKNTKMIEKIKKDIARILTLLNK
ncbi:MAG: 50S ribosomal protein L29 [Candidatus Pacebacteria bacterium]|nr:50S ribosomal protein L29 [Candidatus Paceibacterota bacterium]